MNGMRVSAAVYAYRAANVATKIITEEICALQSSRRGATGRAALLGGAVAEERGGGYFPGPS
jgi:hypothetical protein